jgi:hypothetical protein
MAKQRRVFCTRKGCMTRTCSKHWKHLPKWTKYPVEWESFEDCCMYTGFDKIPLKNKDDEDDEVF